MNQRAFPGDIFTEGVTLVPAEKLSTDAKRRLREAWVDSWTGPPRGDIRFLPESQNSERKASGVIK